MCGPQYTVLDRIADLLALQHGSRLLTRNRCLVKGFVLVGVKRLACGIEGLDMVLEERVEQETMGRLYTFVELSEVRRWRLLSCGIGRL